MDDRKTVLVVDDDDSWRDLISHSLQPEFMVVSASSYRQAKNILDNVDSPFHLLVADISLKGGGADKEGMALINAVREFKPFTGVIIVTGYPSIETAKSAFTTLDVFDYLEKYPGHGQEFNRDYFLAVVREAIAETMKRRAGLSVRRSAAVLVFVGHEDLRLAVVDMLRSVGDLLVDGAAPSSDAEENRRHLSSRLYDLVITEVNPSDDSEKVLEQLECIRENSPGADLLGIGQYDSGHKLLINAITRLGLTNFVDLRELSEVKHRSRALTAFVARKYVVAQIEGVSLDGILEINRHYRLVVTVRDAVPEGLTGVAIPFLSGGTKVIKLNSVISAVTVDMDIQPGLTGDIIVYSSGEIKPAEFHLVPTAFGSGEIVFELYREGRWLRRLRIGVSTKGQRPPDNNSDRPSAH